MPSRVCPDCGAGVQEPPGRRVRCPGCGLEEGRDRIPVLWALKLA